MPTRKTTRSTARISGPLCTARTRTGEAIKPPDYDGDGKVSLAEAHAYALIHSETVDISMKTSDVFLRRYSSFRANGVEGMVTAEADFDQLLDLAGPADHAVLSELSTLLKLDGKSPVRDARVAADSNAQRRRSIDQQRSRLSRTHDQLRGVLQARVVGHWPELGNLLNPSAEKLIADEGDAVVKFIEAAPQFKDFAKQEKDIDDLDHQSFDLERTWVKYQRFIRTAENVALAANLPKVAKEDIVERFKKLVEAEGGWLGAGASEICSDCLCRLELFGVRPLGRLLFNSRQAKACTPNNSRRPKGRTPNKCEIVRSHSDKWTWRRMKLVASSLVASPRARARTRSPNSCSDG